MKNKTEVYDYQNCRITFIRPELMILLDLGFSYTVRMKIENGEDIEYHTITSDEYLMAVKKIKEEL